MNTLLLGFLKTKYGYNDKQALQIIEKSKSNDELLEWYQIAIIKIEEEMNKNVSKLQCKPTA